MLMEKMLIDPYVMSLRKQARFSVCIKVELNK